MTKTVLQERLQQCRQELVRLRVDAYLVPTTDAFLSEFTPPYAERLAWLTGFTGSNGTALISQDDAIFFTDGRYTIQARDQLIPAFSILNMMDTSIPAWLSDHAGELRTVGYDPRLFSAQRIASMEALLEDHGVQLKALNVNPVDRLWKEHRPEPAQEMVQIHPMQYAGECSFTKRQRLCQKLKEDQLHAIFIAAPDSLAWLLNIRAMDVPHTPNVLAHGLLQLDEEAEEGRLTLFIDEARVSAELREHLGSYTTFAAPKALEKYFSDLGMARQYLMMDPQLTPQLYFQMAEEEGVRVIEEEDPIQAMKALKNTAEIAGAQAAHIRDGVAVTRFLHWLHHLESPKSVTELDVVAQLRAFREEAPLFVDDSFDTIAGFGPHGAIVHYRATQETAIALAKGNLLLVDSGGQYPDGTTDVTRTMAIGEPTDEHRRAYTLVLKGHIALARATFPKGTTGSQLDGLARYALWQQGLDYDHGTGHGVGSYLGVHEGPQRISKSPSRVALEPGMILSNEPGYYKEGAYGIRIENLVHVVERPDLSRECKFLGFENLTMVPLERRLIDTALLSPEECAWVDEYHQGVYERLQPELPAEVAEWLKLQTKPLCDA